MAVRQELLGFVREALERGSARQDVEDALRRAGWAAPEVRNALAAWSDVPFVLPVPRPRPYLDARDAFLYLVTFATLYVCAYHFGQLAFQFIDRLLPDPADPDFPGRAQLIASTIRFSMASLIVAAPVFLFVSRVIAREIRIDPAKRGSRVRRWLTYATLFVAAAVLIGDVTTLVYTALGGDLTVRFVLKVLTVGVIAGGGFGYYLSDLRADEREAS